MVRLMTNNPLRSNRCWFLLVALTLSLSLSDVPWRSSTVQAQPEVNDEFDWRTCLVRLRANRTAFNFYQPWTPYTAGSRNMGVVISEKTILTTADGLQNNLLVQFQKGGRGRWYKGRIVWIDYHTNLATLTVDEESFWTGMQPISLAPRVPSRGEVMIVRWKDGIIQRWSADVTSLVMDSTYLSATQHLFLEVTSDIDAAGWGELIVKDNQLLGITTEHDSSRVRSIPAPIISHVLRGHRKQPYPGVGHFDFTWQNTANPAVTARFGLPGDSRGILVRQVPPLSPSAKVLKPNDIILSINTFDIDSQGDYEDPLHGYLRFTNLAVHGVYAGDVVPMTLWRDGKELTVDYTLPKVDFAKQLVPIRVLDRQPEYAIAGGLVFQPLTEDYLRSWGKSWWKKAPFRLRHFAKTPQTKEKPHIIILSTVLPDPVSHGYDHYRYLVVERINGKAVTRIADVLEAFKSPVDGYHVVEFTQGLHPRKLVMDAASLEQATQRVLTKYGIDKASHVEPHPSF